MVSSPALIKIAVPRGCRLHFLYSEEGPSFTQFPRDKLIQHSRTARLQLQGSRKDTFIINVEPSQVNGTLSSFFHVLDFIKTHGHGCDSGPTTLTSKLAPVEIPLADFPHFTQLLHIHFAAIVLGLDGGLEQPKLRTKLVDMALQKCSISVDDMKFLWSHFRGVDNLLITAALRTVVAHVEYATFSDEAIEGLKHFLADDEEFCACFRDLCATKDGVTSSIDKSKAVERRLQNYRPAPTTVGVLPAKYPTSGGKD